jgi:PAS domain S-box-containing protein
MMMNAREEIISLLIIEDNPGDARLIREMLSDTGTAFDVTTVERLGDALVLLHQRSFDTLLLDLNLPDSQGLETLNKVFARVPETPIIVLTGIDDETIGVRAISEGGQDYLVKGRFDPALLVRAIQYACERKKTEKALQASERRYKSLFDTTMDGIYQSDAEARMVMINRAGAEMLGHRSPDEMIGKNVAQYWEDPAEREAFVAELKRGKSVRAYPIRGKNVRGETVYLETSSHVLEDEKGRFLGIEGILRNVTEHRRLEEQYRQAQKMEAIGQLAGGVAHDFNNILSAIIGYAHLTLMKMGEDDPLRHNIEQILASSQRATVLTQSLLAFSRKQMINPVLLDLNDLLRRFEKFLLRLIREDIEFKTLFTGVKLPVMADGGQLEQAIMNLVTNARDAMPRGGCLTIETRRVTLGEDFFTAQDSGVAGRYAMISLTDTGVGMDENTKRHIYEPFFTTKEQGKGTGLGLSMVYGIVKKHDGYINVYSEPDRGTSFKIYLPLVHENAGWDEKAEPEAAPALEGSETILLAEDDASVRNLVVTVLTQFGYRVIEAENGEEAVRRFIEHKDDVQLAVLDSIMPRKNGGEACQEIKQARPDIKVLFMSGYPEDTVGRHGILEPGTDFIAKPVSPADLLKKMREILDRDRSEKK